MLAPRSMMISQIDRRVSTKTKNEQRQNNDFSLKHNS
jgi:hypothetical protein